METAPTPANPPLDRPGRVTASIATEQEIGSVSSSGGKSSCRIVRLVAESQPHPNGASIEGAGVENHLGPVAVMWMQSSNRTPNLPGM